MLDAKTQKWASLEDGVRKLIIGLSETRRMKRDVDEKYGVEGEFYVDGDGECGQAKESNITARERKVVNPGDEILDLIREIVQDEIQNQ